MLDQTKQKIIEAIKKAKESGELTAHNVYDIAHEAAMQSAQELKKGAGNLRGITKETVTVSVQALVDAQEATEEKISAALHGTIDGIKQVESDLLETADKKFNEAKTQIQEGEEKLAESLNDAFDGAKEAAQSFSEDVQADVETALSDIKLKSTDLLDLTQTAVKEAVSKAIETGGDVEDVVLNPKKIS